MHDARTVVVLRALGLGDFLTGVPAYRAIGRAFPSAKRILAAPRALVPLLALVGTAIDEIVDTVPLGPLDRNLHRADVAIDLHGSGPESHRVLLDAHARHLIAFSNAAIPQSRAGAAWRADEHEVVRWCRMLETAGIPCDPDDLDLAAPQALLPSGMHGVTVVHPGASAPARRWPDRRWAAVIRAERAQGRTVAITGSAGEGPRAQRIAALAGESDIHVLAGRTDLRDVADLVARAGRVVCGDTGIAHLATALRTPSVVLFGPVSPAAWGPPERPIHRVLWAGRRGDTHANRIDAGMLALSVDAVVRTLQTLPDRARC